MGQPAPQFSLDSLRSHFKVMRECPVCTTGFEPEQIRTVESIKGSHVLHATCPVCSNSLIFLVGSTQLGIGLIGMVSDLTYEDSVRFRKKESLTEDELIECYQALGETSVLRQLLGN
ncbi:MAG TPA: hypothetical protein PK295_04705 [Candidatus Magasanikbacteria bacterium]|nr:hypothetical protein [Candidatus Magasanikbacteria bacterium]